ncbi:GM16120 [Drosophila sechellia]|uniref:GM16120 n=1 Tax=Drosophila sechellia TaxID=7238 RepID=B4III4_DROSE|nr:GM16120 [Drosophila sechellia]
MTQSHHYNCSSISLCPAILPSCHAYILPTLYPLGCSHSGCLSPNQARYRSPIAFCKLVRWQSVSRWRMGLSARLARSGSSCLSCVWHLAPGNYADAANWPRHGNRATTEIGPGNQRRLQMCLPMSTSISMSMSMSLVPSVPSLAPLHPAPQSSACAFFSLLCRPH